MDGELSQLERRMVESHLARCAECHAYAADVVEFTERIRSEPLAVLGKPIAVRRQRRLATAQLHVGVAAAAAIVALGIGTRLATPEEPQPGPQLSRFEGMPSLSPPRSVLEQEQAILRVVRAGRTLPPPGSVL